MLVPAFIGLSDTGEGALIAGIASLLTLILSQAWNYFHSKAEAESRLQGQAAELAARAREQEAERAEWYRRTLFERRLKALNEAYGWAMQINRLVNLVGTSDTKDPSLVDELIETSKKGRDWYNENGVYLNDDLPTSSNFIYILNASTAVLRDDSHFNWQWFNDLLKELRERTQELLKPVREPG